MKVAVLCLTLLFCCTMPACGLVDNPIQKVVSMLSDLEAKITKEGAASQKAFEEFTEWCEERSANVGYEIKTGKSDVAELKATIEKADADIESLTAKIEELTAALTTDDADLKAATEIRTTEAADFAANEKELLEVISTLERAIMILEREMKKGGASFAQIQKAGNNVAQALKAMVDASMLASKDVDTLTALVQDSDEAEDGSDETGAPDPSVYESHSGGIVETLEGLLDKAKEELDDARTKETQSLHSFEVLKQSIEDSIKYGEKDLAAAKKALAGTSESKATAEGDLTTTSKDLAEDIDTLGTLKHDCMTKAEDYEAEVKSRSEELKALAQAKKVILDTTSGAESLSYGLDQLSFLQVDTLSKLKTAADLANFEAVRFVRDLARRQHDTALSQLAMRMEVAARYSSNDGADPFAKVKGLIMDMIERLEEEAQADASHKAYCDKQTGESLTKKAETETEIDKLTTKIDSMKAKSAQLKEQIAGLQKELADLAASQAAMDKMRNEEHTAFVANKADMEKGLEGVKMALSVLNDYYNKEGAAHEAAVGAGTGIIGLLEVVESDFSKGLAEMVITEETAARDYDKETKENEISKVTKEQDVKYKTKESTSLDASVAESTSDLTAAQAELAAVNEYLAKLDDMCIAKPDTYAEKARRRSAEIAGLKEALKILDSQSFLQKKTVLRGVRRVL